MTLERIGLQWSPSSAAGEAGCLLLRVLVVLPAAIILILIIPYCSNSKNCLVILILS